MTATTLDAVMQAAIAFTGCLALWLVTRRARWARWGHVVGLAGQPFWLVAAASHEQWGIFAVALVYTAVFAEGVWHEFFRR
jgi:hypothetical protein